VAAGLVAASVWLWFGVAAPARRQRDTARDEFARVRAERERVRARAEVTSRQAEAGRTPEAGAAAARELRRSLLRATEGLSVGAIRISTSGSARGRVAASGRLTVEGPLDALLSVSDRLADPASGVLVRRVTLLEAEPGGAAVQLELEATSVRAGS
jgi:hypothetical protein